MQDTQTIGIYLDTSTILRNPGYLELLRERVGLGLVILGFSGTLPQRVLDLSPFDGTPPSDACLASLLCQHVDGAPGASSLDPVRGACGPHMHAGGDDDALRQAIQRVRQAGLRLWLLGGGWTANDFSVVMFCPSQERNNAWYEAVYTHMATEYGADGVDVTHARYPMTSYPRGMFLCSCAHCAAAAAELGYDMARMLADIRAADARLGRLDARRAVGVLAETLGATDALSALGLPGGLVDWFAFRTRLLERNVARFRRAVHAAAGPECVFGVDTYPASLAMFVGHDQTRWDRFSDFASPLVSHLDIFPMKTLAAWSDFLRRRWPAAPEAGVLQLLYRLVGYDTLRLPASTAAFALGEPDCEFRNVPLVDWVLRDTAKARVLLPADMPSYPIIQGGGAPHLWPRESIQAIMEGLRAQGHQGWMLQGTDCLVDYRLQR